MFKTSQRHTNLNKEDRIKDYEADIKRIRGNMKRTTRKGDFKSSVEDELKIKYKIMTKIARNDSNVTVNGSQFPLAEQKLQRYWL